MPPKTSDAVRDTIVQWLKVKENFLLITGAAGFNSAVVSGQKLKKKDAYGKLAQFVNQKHNTTFTEKEIKNKYDWMLQKFKKAKEKSQTEENPDKLEEMCPFYKELDQLFGDRQNVNPFSLFEPIQIPERTENNDENILSSSLESVHITDETRNVTPSNGKKRKGDDEPPESPTKKKLVTNKKKESSSEEKSSPFNSKSNSSGKNGKDFTSSFISSQKEKWKIDKERFDKEIEIKQQETEVHNKRLEKELEIRDEELNSKNMKPKQTLSFVKENWNYRKASRRKS